jgi:hypothetical protein
MEERQEPIHARPTGDHTANTLCGENGKALEVPRLGIDPNWITCSACRNRLRIVEVEGRLPKGFWPE